MTRYFLCYRILIIARHPRYSGEDLPQPVHLPRGRHHLLQVQASGVLPHTRIQVSLEALLTHRWVRDTVHHRCCGGLHLEGKRCRPLDRLC
jgi:hypothetical protein